MGRSLYVEVCHANNIVSVMMSSLFHEIPYRVLDSHSHSKKNGGRVGECLLSVVFLNFLGIQIE